MNWWPTIGETLAHLGEEGLLDANQERTFKQALTDLPPRVPWYLKGALFLGGALAATVLACSCAPLMALGPSLFAVAGVVLAAATTTARWLRPSRHADLIDPVLFAMALAAPPLVATGLTSIAVEFGQSFSSFSLAMAASAGFGALFVLVYPDRWLRTFITVWVWACLTAIRLEVDVPLIGDVVIGVCLTVGVIAAAARPVLAGTPLRPLLQPIGLGSALFALASMARFWSGWEDESWIAIVGVGTGVMALAATGWTLYRTESPPLGWVVGLVGAALLAALGLSIPGLATALAFLLLALLGRDLPLAVAAIVAMIAYGAWAYTEVDLPVVAKALTLVGSGVVLLALREAMRRFIPAAATR